jgi:hypothetical protein
VSPKFLICHKFEHGKLRDEHKVVYVNPRRVDYFAPNPPPSQQPTLFCGTLISFGGKKTVVVHETVDELEKMLKR